MKQPRNYKPVAAVMMVLVMTIIGMSIGHPTHATATGGAPVTIMNTSANPLPVNGTVTVSGTPSVTVANNANVTVSNTPNVSLAGTPTVNVGNLPAVQSVSFSNGPGSPLYTRDVDGPAHHPFAQRASCVVGPCEVKISVPTGSELVIEMVEIDADVAVGAKTIGKVFASVNGSYVFFYIPMTLQFNNNGLDLYAAVQPVRIYADGGTTVLVDANASDLGVSISGYTVSCSSSGQGSCPP